MYWSYFIKTNYNGAKYDETKNKMKPNLLIMVTRGHHSFTLYALWRESFSGKLDFSIILDLRNWWSVQRLDGRALLLIGRWTLLTPGWETCNNNDKDMKKHWWWWWRRWMMLLVLLDIFFFWIFGKIFWICF